MASFLNPLVVWPTIECYLPSIPLSGALAAGTVLVTGLLIILIGIQYSWNTVNIEILFN